LYGRPSVWSVETELVWNATRAFVLCLFGVNEHADSRKLLPTIKQGQTDVKYLSQFCHIAVVKPPFFPLSRQNRRMAWVVAVRSAKLSLEETFSYSNSMSLSTLHVIRFELKCIIASLKDKKSIIIMKLLFKGLFIEVL